MHSLSEARRALATIDLVPGLATSEVHTRLQQGARLHATGQRIVAFYLTEMADRRLYQKTGHSSAAFYAESVLGLERRRTGELIAVGRKLLTLPAIDRAFCEQEIGWAKLMLLVRVASPAHESAWLARARELSCRQLALEVKLHKPGSRPRKPGDRKGLPEVRFPHAFNLAPLAHQKVELAKAKLSAELGHPVGDAECLEVMAELFLNLEEDGSVPGRNRVSASIYRLVVRPDDAGGDSSRSGASSDRPLVVDTELGPIPLAAGSDIDGVVDRDIGGDIQSACVSCDAEAVFLDPEVRADDGRGDVAFKTPADKTLAPKTPPALRRKVLARDGNCCCCCGSRWGLMVHHIRYRSDGGSTEASNLITVCSSCHAMVHADLLVLVGKSADEIAFHTKDGVILEQAGGQVQREHLLRLSAPPRAASPAAEVEGRPETVVTLDSVPDLVDGTWWRRHAHLFRFGKRGELEFRPGCASSQEAGPAKAGLDVGVPVKARPCEDAFPGFLGQDGLLRRLRAAAEGSRAQGRPCPHILFVGAAGTGKTTLAQGVSRAYGTQLHATSGPLLESAQVLVGILTSLEQGDMLFLDEVHAIPRVVLEVLYEAMAERRVSLAIRLGSRVRTVQLALPAFTVVAATTEEGDLPLALRSRFGLLESIGFYEMDALAMIAKTKARARGFTLRTQAASTLAAHARGTPREVLRLLDRILEVLVHERHATNRCAPIEDSHVRAALRRLGYDAQRLSPAEQRYVRLLRDSPRPIPLRRLARMLGSSPQTLVDVLEPDLFRRGFVEMTSNGRQLVRRPHRLPAQLCEL